MMFIGGPVDGQKIEVLMNCNTIETQPLEKVPVSQWISDAIIKAELKKVRYNKMPFKGKGGPTRFVMAEEGLSPDKVLCLLIDNYKPGE